MVDLVAFGGVAAARNGLTNMPVNSNENFFKILKVNNLVAEEDTYVLAATVITAAIANLAQSRFKRADMADWMDLGNFGRDQTGPYTTNELFRCCYKVPSGKQLIAALNNGNNSQVDIMGFFLGKGPNDKIMFGGAGNFANLLAEGYELVRFTGVKTLTAALWSEVELTAITWTPDNFAKYHIAAMCGWGATGTLGRLKHKKSGTQGIRPGFLVGDDASPPVTCMTYQDFGEFQGDSYPVVQHISVAADTAQEYIALIKKVG